MFKWLGKMGDYNFAKRGNIGGTTDFFCMGYLSCVDSITLKDKWKGLVNPPDTQEKRTEELNNLFDFMITIRFQTVPDELQENKIRQQELTKFGAFSFIASILKVEADLHINDDYWIKIFLEVIGDGLKKNSIPEWVVKGESLDGWDPIELFEFLKEPPK